MYFLAQFCRTPVKKLCVKKNPEIQKVIGLPQSIHFWKKANLALRSDTQEPKGFNEGYDFPIHNSGTLPLNNDFDAAYNEGFITILPNIASLMSFSEDLTILMRLLNLCNY